MNFRIFLLAVAASLAACQPDAPPAEAEAAEPAPAPSASQSGDLIASPERLAGEYRIAGVDGGEIDLPHGITASITESRILVTSDCVSMEWDYRFEDGTIATTRAPVMSCQRGLYPEEEAIAAALDAASEIHLTPANGYEFTGGGHSVTLFTQ